MVIRKGIKSQFVPLWRKLLHNLSQRFQLYSFIVNIQPKNYVFSHYGVYLRERRKDLTYTYAISGHYGNFISDILLNVKDDTIFLDIGSNVGLFSLIADKNPNIYAIYAFEPDPITFLYLSDNLKRSKSTKISPHNVAIGQENTTAFLTQSYGHSGGATLISKKRTFNRTRRKIKVINETILDSLIQKSNMKYFVKIDVEGSELDVLLTLAKSRIFEETNYFLIEFDINYQTASRITQFLVTNGFSEFSRSGNLNHWDALWGKIETKI